MRDYEILFILKPNLGDDKNTEMVKQFENWISSSEGEISKLDIWGLKDLASTFQKFTKGYFVLCEFKGTPKTLNEIKQRIGVNENFIRYLLVRLESVKAKPKPVKVTEKQHVES